MTPHLRPGARVVKAAHGRVPPDLLLGLDAAAEDDLASRRSHHDGLDEEHDHDEFESFVMAPRPRLTTPPPSRPGSASQRTHTACCAPRASSMSRGSGGGWVVQAVGHPRSTATSTADWRTDEARESRLVVIGLGPLDRAAVEAAIRG